MPTLSNMMSTLEATSRSNSSRKVGALHCMWSRPLSSTGLSRSSLRRPRPPVPVRRSIFLSISRRVLRTPLEVNSPNSGLDPPSRRSRVLVKVIMRRSTESRRLSIRSTAASRLWRVPNRTSSVSRRS